MMDLWDVQHGKIYRSMIKLQNIGGREYIFDRYKRNVESAMNKDYRQKFEENLRFGIEYSKITFQIEYFLCKLNISH